MEGVNDSHLILNTPDYREAILAGQDFYMQFTMFSPDIEATLVKILHRYLEKYDTLYLKDMLFTVVKELINNAVKANAKRLYFKLKTLDINKKEDYRQGMETFKEESYGKGTEFFDELGKTNLVVRVAFKSTPDSMRIYIINNVPILEEELKKVEARVKKAYQYTDISEAFDDVLDDSEGAGLGLIMALMLFKSAGLPEETFTIKRETQLTVGLLTIPVQPNRSETNAIVAEEIFKEVDNLPSFPENIIEIQKLCSNPESTIRSIADSILRDPGLTTSILKLANSAGYITLNKVETIEDAVKIIGLKGINTLLVATSVQKIIDSRYRKYETIWKNSYKSAFYAQRIAIQLKKTRLSEFVYLAALLADIGRIVLISLKPERINKLRDIAGLKGLENADILEEMSLGISHNTLASLIFKKWKFNEALIKAVEYHHRPYMAPERYRDLIYIVYLADVFAEIENRKFRFEIVDEDVLDFFNLNSREKFELLHKVLKEAYQTHLGTGAKEPKKGKR